MATHLTTTQAARIGKLKGEILKHAVPVEVLGLTGQQKQMPKNVGATVVFRRWLPYDATTDTTDGAAGNRIITGTNVDTYAASHLTQEGVTPSADVLTAVDVEATLQEYACLYAVSNRVVDLYEDDVPEEMKQQTGERIGLIREMVRYGELKGMVHVHYAGGNSMQTVDESLSLPVLRRAARALKANHAKKITSILAPSANFATAPVEAAYLAFCSTDMEPAIRDLPGFKPIAEYGQRKPVHEQEVGSVEEFRFVTSPELAPLLGQGAAVGQTGLLSLGNTNVDCYPVILVGQDAWGQVALRGQNSLDVTYIPPSQKDKNDPLGQRGYIGAITYFTAKMLNDGWAAVIWAGTPALAA